MAKIPRNIRRVGTPEGNLSIYIEDYVFTYLKSEYNNEAAVLVGESVYEEEEIKVIIRGLISCPQIYWREEGMEMTGRTWNYLYQELEHLYKNQEIVGWYLPISNEDAEHMLFGVGQFHGRYFQGADKVFFYLDTVTGDDAFYTREGQVFKRQGGYYVFYEKNTVMREYMLSRREQKQLEADLYKEVHDQPRELMRYREYMQTELTKKDKESGIVAYIFSVFAMVSVFALVVGIASGYNKLNQSEETAQEVIEEVAVETERIEPAVEENAVESGSLIEETQFDTAPEQPISEVDQAITQGYYIVEKGESLAAICRKLYGTDEKVSAICEKNGITNPDAIYPGQILYLP